VLDGDEPASAWRRAATLGVEQLAMLPSAAEWLSQRIIAAVEPPVTPGVTVGIVAGCGGAGASVLASALARRAAKEVSTVLVDADPLG
ncbi:helicase, partial [Acinetobacter baumannii]